MLDLNYKIMLIEMRKVVLGMLLLWVMLLLVWITRLLKLVALSTTETEYVAKYQGKEKI